MRVHKRKKNSRIRGSRTYGWGFRQKHKGHGNKGGHGMSGSGKKADHKKQFALNKDKNKIYFGKKGLTSRSTKRKKSNKINLLNIKNNYFKKEGDKLNFKDHKILGEGTGFKAEIIASSASKSAIEKMNSAGGKIILPEKKNDVKQHVAKESKDKKEIPKEKEVKVEKKEVKKENKPQKVLKDKKEVKKK